MQAHIHIYNLDYCDFVVWITQGLFVERILPDAKFWEVVTQEANYFFYNGILSVVVGRWFARALVPSFNDSLSSDDDYAYWCVCQTHIEDSTLIWCDNKMCTITWYHPGCVHLQQIPKDDWLCLTCHIKA